MPITREIPIENDMNTDQKWQDAEGDSYGPKDTKFPEPPPFIDLAPYLDGTAKQEIPTVAEVWEGRSLFYAGRLNEVHAEPGTGKTNVLMAACISVMDAGGSVLFIDPEDTPKGFATRILMLGADPEAIRSRVFYLHNPDPDEIHRAQTWAKEHSPNIVILDGLAESMAAVGANEDKAQEALAAAGRQFDPSKGDFTAYAAQAVRNALRSLYEKQVRHHHHHAYVLDQPAGMQSTQTDLVQNTPDKKQESVGTQVNRAESIAALKRAMAQMPERYRVVLSAVAEGRSYSEIGILLGMTKQGVHKIAAAAT